MSRCPAVYREILRLGVAAKLQVSSASEKGITSVIDVELIRSRSSLPGCERKQLPVALISGKKARAIGRLELRFPTNFVPLHGPADALFIIINKLGFCFQKHCSRLLSSIILDLGIFIGSTMTSRIDKTIARQREKYVFIAQPAHETRSGQQALQPNI
jgi:hypothetical protein